MADLIDKAKDKLEGVEGQMAGHLRTVEAEVGALKDKAMDASRDVKQEVKETIEKVKDSLTKD